MKDIVHLQCAHGDARCSKYLSCKRATYGITHVDGTKSFTIWDYSPLLYLCDYHYEEWSEDRYYKGDKEVNEYYDKSFGKRDIKPPTRIVEPYWAMRVNVAPTARRAQTDLDPADPDNWY